MEEPVTERIIAPPDVSLEWIAMVLRSMACLYPLMGVLVRPFAKLVSRDMSHYRPARIAASSMALMGPSDIDTLLCSNLRGRPAQADRGRVPPIRHQP